MKVYEMNGYDLVAANSEEEAVAWYTRKYGGLPADEALDEGCPREISAEEMATREVTDEFGPTVTFAEHLERTTARGNPPATEPFLFASTEY